MTPAAAKKRAEQRKAVEKRKNERISKKAIKESKIMMNRCRNIQRAGLRKKVYADYLGRKIERLQAKKEDLDILVRYAERDENRCMKAADDLYKKHLDHKKLSQQ